MRSGFLNPSSSSKDAKLGLLRDQRSAPRYPGLRDVESSWSAPRNPGVPATVIPSPQEAARNGSTSSWWGHPATRPPPGLGNAASGRSMLPNHPPPSPDPITSAPFVVSSSSRSTMEAASPPSVATHPPPEIHQIESDSTVSGVSSVQHGPAPLPANHLPAIVQPDPQLSGPPTDGPTQTATPTHAASTAPSTASFVTASSLTSSYPSTDPVVTASPLTSSSPATFTPLYPYKTVEVPKAALNALYGKPPRRSSLSADLYHTWHNSGPPHDLRWSSIFVCPLTAEFFLTAIYSAAQMNAITHKDDLVWYRKKTSAEHGAAARAYDCCSYRDFVATDPTIAPFCTLVVDQLPYLPPTTETGLPASVPAHIIEKVQQQRAQILQSRGGGVAPMQVDASPGAEEPVEMAWQGRPDETMSEDDVGGIYGDAA